MSNQLDNPVCLRIREYLARCVHIFVVGDEPKDGSVNIVEQGDYWYVFVILKRNKDNK